MARCKAAAACIWVTKMHPGRCGVGSASGNKAISTDLIASRLAVGRVLQALSTGRKAAVVGRRQARCSAEVLRTPTVFDRFALDWVIGTWSISATDVCFGSFPVPSRKRLFRNCRDGGPSCNDPLLYTRFRGRRNQTVTPPGDPTPLKGLTRIRIPVVTASRSFIKTAVSGVSTQY